MEDLSGKSPRELCKMARDECTVEESRQKMDGGVEYVIVTKARPYNFAMKLIDEIERLR